MGRVLHFNSYRPTIHVALAFDKSYLTPFYVVTTSVLRNNSDSCVHFHVICTGLNARQKNDVENYISKNGGRLSFYQLSPEKLNGIAVSENSYLPLACYYRLFFPALIPDRYGRFIYLDTDLVVNRSLLSLYNSELASKPAAAVTETSATKTRIDLGITERGEYFNSGVMVIDIYEWKRQGITEKAIRVIREKPEKMIYGDQDALNVVLRKNYAQLDSRYNIIHTDVPLNLTREGYREYVKDKVVIHYTFPENKPWYFLSRSKLRFLYHDYRKQAFGKIGPKYFGLIPKHAPAGKLIRSRIREVLSRFPALFSTVKSIKKVNEKSLQLLKAHR